MLASATIPYGDGSFVNIDTGLLSWVQKYGITVENRSIQDAAHVYRDPKDVHPGWADGHCEPMAPLVDYPRQITAVATGESGLAVPYAFPIALDRGRQPGLRFDVLASVEHDDPTIPASPVMVYARGRFQSTYGRGAGEGQLLVISSSSFLRDVGAMGESSTEPRLGIGNYAQVYLPAAAAFITQSARALTAHYMSACEVVSLS